MTPERLRQVDTAESALRALGIGGNLRVRHYGELARVELDRELLSVWRDAAAFERLAQAVCTAGFTTVELDPRGFRSGSLNVLAATASQHRDGGDTTLGAALPGH